MKKVSTARAKQLREYAKLKREFLRKSWICEACGKTKDHVTLDLHHRFGRVGRLLCWEPGFLCLCRTCHSAVHCDPEQDGRYFCPKGCWNDFRRAVAWHNQKDTK